MVTNCGVCQYYIDTYGTYQAKQILQQRVQYSQLTQDGMDHHWLSILKEIEEYEQRNNVICVFKNQFL